MFRRAVRAGDGRETSSLEQPFPFLAMNPGQLADVETDISLVRRDCANDRAAAESLVKRCVARRADRNADRKTRRGQTPIQDHIARPSWPT